MTYAQIYAHEMRNQNKSPEIVLHLIGCKSATLLDVRNHSKLRFESLTHRFKRLLCRRFSRFVRPLRGCPQGHAGCTPFRRVPPGRRIAPPSRHAPDGASALRASELPRGRRAGAGRPG